MSDTERVTVSCPTCDDRQEADLFRSVNARLLPQFLQAVAAGTFEWLHWQRCGDFQPEHPPLLYIHHSLATATSLQWESQTGR